MTLKKIFLSPKWEPKICHERDRQRCGIVVTTLLAEEDIVLLHISLLIKINVLSPWKWCSGFIFSLNPEIILFIFLICQGLTDKSQKLWQNSVVSITSQDNSIHFGSALPLFGTLESLLILLQDPKNVELFFKVEEGAFSLNFLCLCDSLRNDPYRRV